MKIKKETIILISLILFSSYVSIIVGMSWDEIIHQDNGRNLIRYLLSFGNLEYKSSDLPFHFGFYDAFSHFIASTVPSKFTVYSNHLTNMAFSISAIFGITQFTKILFNKQISKIVFFLTFLNPVFFGHMSINPKDTIIAFSLIWLSVLVLKYIKYQHIDVKRKKYTYLICITLFIGIGIRLTFIGTLIPIILILFYEILLNKKNNKKFKLKTLLIDFTKVLLIAYSVTIIFWPEMHQNLFRPQEVIIDYIDHFKKGNYGLYWGLLDGKIINLSNTPSNYLIISFFYKMPEFFVVSLPLLFFILLFDFNFFTKKINNFKKGLIYLLLFIIIPIFLFVFLSLKVIAGLKFFLFIIPFLSILPAIVFYYFLEKRNFISKFLLSIFSFLFLFYFLTFIKITPYQYTYINSFNGKFSNNINKFENDYWGISLKQLIYKFRDQYPIIKDKEYNIAFCGIGTDIAEFYLKKIKTLKYKKVSNKDEYDFIIMTNRLNGNKYDTVQNIDFCYDEFKGKNLFYIERMDLKLSILRSKKN